MARIIGEVRPRYAFIENSPALVNRGLDRVLADLASLGFDARWTVLGASDVEAPHHRQRIWILGHAIGQRCDTWRDHNGQHDRPEPCANGQHTQPVAYADSLRKLQPQGSQQDQRGRPCHCGTHVADASGQCREGEQCREPDPQDRAQPGDRQAGPRRICIQRWPIEPGLGRVADGVAHRANRIKAIGNGQVPRVAATAFHFLMSQL